MKDWKEIWPDRVSPAGRVKQGLKSEQKLEIFVYRANQVHGDKYDYSKSVYKTAKDKIVITCPDHGDFLQIPENHILREAGCPSCAGKKQKTTEEFISQAKSVHRETYDYSKVKYINNHTKVLIICPVHGEFLQAPTHHLHGVGCPTCGGTRLKTQQEFEIDAVQVHGDRYDYTVANYINTATKISIMCREHGIFEQTPHKHLLGQGCPKCTDQRESTHLYFLDYGKGVYKFGVTVDLYGQRLARLKRESGQEISVIMYKKLADPVEIEQYLLRKYTNKPALDSKFDGYTELRSLTEEEVKEICSFLETI